MAKQEAKKQDLEVVKGGQDQLPAHVATGDWGSEGVSTADIIIPKILVMQGMSKFVGDDKIQARMGELRDSLNATNLGGKENAVEMIVFQSERKWLIFEEEQGQMKYRKQEDMTPANESWPLEETINGVKIRRDKALNYYCILPGDVEKGMPFPYLVSFRRTSFQAGRKLATSIAKMRAFKQPAASTVFKLTTSKVENDKGKFAVADVVESRKSTAKEVAAAYEWYQALKHKKAKVDESDLVAEGAPVEVDNEQF